MRKPKIQILIITLVFLASQLFFPKTIAANEDWNYGIKTPNQALHEVFEPIRNSFSKALEIAKNIVVKIYEIIKIVFWWLFDLVRPAFDFVDRWFEKLTGLAIGETFGKIGGFFVYLVDVIADAIKKLLSLIPLHR